MKLHEQRLNPRLHESKDCSHDPKNNAGKSYSNHAEMQDY